MDTDVDALSLPGAADSRSIAYQTHQEIFISV